MKSCYAGRVWDGAEYARRLADELPRLEALAQPEKVIAPGIPAGYAAPEKLVTGDCIRPLVA